MGAIGALDLASPPPKPSAPIDWDFEVRSHRARVVASLLALRVPFEHAEELASQAWARLIEQHRDGRLVDVKLPGLAIAQARFLALSWLRTRRRETELPDDLIAADDPERSVGARREIATVLRVLGGCSKTAQAVVHALYDDPPPRHEEVARRVGLSTQRVRQIVCEVRAKLRAALEEKS